MPIDGGKNPNGGGILGAPTAPRDAQEKPAAVESDSNGDTDGGLRSAATETPADPQAGTAADATDPAATTAAVGESKGGEVTPGGDAKDLEREAGDTDPGGAKGAVVDDAPKALERDPLDAALEAAGTGAPPPDDAAGSDDGVKTIESVDDDATLADAGKGAVGVSLGAPVAVAESGDPAAGDGLGLHSGLDDGGASLDEGALDDGALDGDGESLTVDDADALDPFDVKGGLLGDDDGGLDPLDVKGGALADPGAPTGTDFGDGFDGSKGGVPGGEGSPDVKGDPDADPDGDDQGVDDGGGKGFADLFDGL